MRSRPLVSAAVFLLATALLGAACGGSSSNDGDVPELGVAYGECSVVTYTPPTATEAFQAMLCRPNEDVARLTGLVLVHGGGGYEGAVQDVASWEQAYRNAGFTTLSIDYYLHDPESARQAWPLPEQNVKAGVQFLRLHEKELGIEHVVLHGWSAGARLGGIVYTTPNNAAFDGPDHWEGVDDSIESFIGFYGYYDGHQFYEDTYYGPNGIPPEAIAINNAGNATGPAELAHGDNDYLIPSQQSIDFNAALEAAGIETNLYIVENSSTHVFDGYGTAEISPEGVEVAQDMVAWYTELMSGHQTEDSGTPLPSG